MATIKLENIQLYAFHGCYKEEQTVGNHFRVDLSLDYDSSNAQTSDQIVDAVNYLDIYEIVREQMGIKSHILENVCKRIIDAISLKYPNVSNLEVKVSKLAPPLGGPIDAVSATIIKK